MKKIITLLFLMLFLSGCGKEKIVIYSSMEEERNQALREQLKEEFDDINIVVQSISTGNSAAKIKNEGKNIEADIILDLETSHILELQDYFADLSDFDDSVYLDNINTYSNSLIWSKSKVSLIIDVDYFKKNNLEIPKTYADLLSSKYKNLIAMPDPKTSGSGYAFYLNVVNIKGEDGAIDYFKKLKNNLREFTTSGSGPTNLLKQGEIAIALGMTTQGASAITEGYNFQIIELESGSPYNTTSCGIIKGRENNLNVMEVFTWIINEFNLYDKENYMPDIILKDQNNKMENYPTYLTDANMTGIESTETKKYLTELWEKVNG